MRSLRWDVNKWTVFQKREKFVSPFCCNGPGVNEIWSWEDWWDGRSEHSGGGSRCSLINEKQSFPLEARTLNLTNGEPQEA